jgi:hypothetical protein
MNQENKNILQEETKSDLKEETKSDLNIFNCAICEKDYKTMKEYNKHIKSEEHEKEHVKKGFYDFTACPYCRLHAYLLYLPEHIKGSHKTEYEQWRECEGMKNINKIQYIKNKLNEIKEQKNTTTLYKDDHNEIKINNDDVKKHKKIIKQVKHRRGKYRHMTEEQINEHKKQLTKERQRRFYEKHRKRYKELNIKNYEKRRTIEPKKRGRPPVYKD